MSSTQLKIVPKDFTPPEIEGYHFVRYVGRGAWKYVCIYEHDVTGARYACKFFDDPTDIAEAQARERGWAEVDILRRESLGGNSTSLPNLAYSTLERTVEGQPYLREEPINRFLSDYLNENIQLSITETTLIARGMAHGLQSLHRDLKIAHGDLWPANIGYDGDIKLSDFGASTVGIQPRRNGGHLLIRAPERFKDEEISQSSDVWSFGSNLHKLFTGKYVLEDELSQAKDEQEAEMVLNALHITSQQWNNIIDAKVSRAEIPKPFRKLLARCLYDGETRIQDGVELVDELEETIRRYEHSQPKARMKRAGFLAAGLAVASLVAGAVWYHGERQEKTLLEKLEEAKHSENYQKRARMIRLYQSGKRNSDDWQELIELGKLEGWHNIFADPKTAIAAYLNKDIVAQAIRINGGATDYETIGRTIDDIDLRLSGQVSALTFNYLDSWMWGEGYKAKQRVVKEWREAQGSLTKRINELVVEYQRLEEQRRLLTTSPGMHAPMVGDITKMKVDEAKDKKVQLLLKLSSLTGDDMFTLEHCLENPKFRFK